MAAFAFPPVLLASKSPRRQALLQQLGIPFELRHQEVDESFPADLPVEEVAEFLARKKAEGIQHFLENDEQVLLTADTTVCQGQHIFNKPRDATHAKAILRRLSGKKHKVVTGVCLWGKQKQLSFSDTAEVFFQPITEKEMDFYIEKYQPYDKAGAYAIQEWIGLAKIAKIEGSYNTIVGLPTQAVYEALRHWNDV